MTSLWIIRDNGNPSSKPLIRKGQDLPQVLVDISDAHNIFGMVWPDWTVSAWGRGTREALVSDPDGAITSLGPVDLVPPKQVSPEEVSAPIASHVGEDPATSPDTASFRLLLLNMQTPANTGWAERLRELPTYIPHINFLVSPGFSLDSNKALESPSGRPVHLFPFLQEEDPKLRCYARWLSTFNYLVENSHNENTQDLVTLAMVLAYLAAELYLRESPKAYPGLASPLPEGEVYTEVIDELGRTAEFLARKDADYGQAFRRFGPEGVMTRAYDKFSRYTTLKVRATAPTYESLLDSLKDMEGYSLILAGLFQESLEEILP